jgi:hypothetical protein
LPGVAKTYRGYRRRLARSTASARTTLTCVQALVSIRMEMTRRGSGQLLAGSRTLYCAPWSVAIESERRPARILRLTRVESALGYSAVQIPSLEHVVQDRFTSLCGQLASGTASDVRGRGFGCFRLFAFICHPAGSKQPASLRAASRTARQIEAGRRNFWLPWTGYDRQLPVQPGAMGGPSWH